MYETIEYFDGQVELDDPHAKPDDPSVWFPNSLKTMDGEPAKEALFSNHNADAQIDCESGGLVGRKSPGRGKAQNIPWGETLTIDIQGKLQVDLDQITDAVIDKLPPPENGGTGGGGAVETASPPLVINPTTHNLTLNISAPLQVVGGALTIDLSSYLPKTGGNVGSLTIYDGNPTLSLLPQWGYAQVAGYAAGTGLPVWSIQPGDGTTAQDFKIFRFNDGGSIISSPTLSISRATGLATVHGDPTAALGIATKQYVDAHAGSGSGTYVDAPSDGVTYGRKNAAWAGVLAITGDILDGGNF